MEPMVCRTVGCFESAIDYVGYCRSHKMGLLPKDYEINDKIASAECGQEMFQKKIDATGEVEFGQQFLKKIAECYENSKANRDKMDNVRYDLVSPFMIESLAKTFAEGATKYGDQNWRKGLPFSNLLNHAMNHLVKYAMGDTSEPHLDHAFWNIGAMIEFRETGREPELNDLYFHRKNDV